MAMQTRTFIKAINPATEDDYCAPTSGWSAHHLQQAITSGQVITKDNFNKAVRHLLDCLEEVVL